MIVSCQSKDVGADLNQQLQTLHEKGLFNGAIMVIEKDSVLLSGGFGYANVESKIPFEINTPMDTGSITKTFTALVIESISKLTYPEYIDAKIAGPLDLEDWFLRPARREDLPNNRAVGYSVEDGIWQVNDSEDFEAFYGDCNLFFSAEDLSKWSRSFLSNPPYPAEKLYRALQVKNSLSDFNVLHWYRLADQDTYHFTGDWKG